MAKLVNVDKMDKEFRTKEKIDNKIEIPKPPKKRNLMKEMNPKINKTDHYKNLLEMAKEEQKEINTDIKASETEILASISFLKGFGLRLMSYPIEEGKRENLNQNLVQNGYINEYLDSQIKDNLLGRFINIDKHIKFGFHYLYEYSKAVFGASSSVTEIHDPVPTNITLPKQEEEGKPKMCSMKDF